MSREVQRIVEDLASRLGRPTAVDDTSFRLQVYSPQVGPLDDVRVTSILFRDSPEEAKRWVLSYQIAEAAGPVRLPAAPDLGLLRRVCVPIRHEGTLLGYLWVIDADGTVTDQELELCDRFAEQLSPLLFRVRALELLDRETEREALAGLIGEDAQGRSSAVDTLQRRGVLSATMRPVALVASVATAGPAGLSDAEAVALEVGIERTRSLVSEEHVAQFRTGDEAVILLGVNDREVVRRGVTNVAERVREVLAGELGRHRVVVGVGREQQSLADAVVSYRQARDVARLLVRIPSLGGCGHVDALRVYRPMLYVPEEVLADSVPELLIELLGRAGSRELAETLESFLDHAGDAARAGEALRLHRATIYKRLARLADLLKVDLGSGAQRRELHHGFAVCRFLGWWPEGR